MKEHDNPKEEHVLLSTIFNEKNELDADIASAILDAFPFYIMLIDSEHHIQLANKAVRSSFDLGHQEIIGKYCPKVIHGLDHPFPGCPLEEAVQKGQFVEMELYDDRIPCWFNSAVYPTRFQTQDGKAIFLHTTHDITKTKQAESEVKKYRDHLEELVRERTEKLNFLVNAMAGREVRMAELKRVIRKLRDQLDNAGLVPVANDPLLEE